MGKTGGYDAYKDIYLSDMVSLGIADPVKVTRSAIENAVSAGGTLLTMGCAMAKVKEEKTQQAPQV